MAAYDYDYLGDLLKKVGGLMTQQRLGNGITFSDNSTVVFGTMTRDGAELTNTTSGPHYYGSTVTIVEVGVYYRFDSTDTTGRPIYSEEGLSDEWPIETDLNLVSVITFTR